MTPTLFKQTELPMRIRQTADQRARADATLLIDVLRKRPDFQRRPSSTICLVMGWTDRRLRAAAEAARGDILSAPGCVGYRLAESTPVADYYKTERPRFLSQIRDMQERLAAMDRAVHAAGTRPTAGA